MHFFFVHQKGAYMTIIERHVFTVIGKVFFDFIQGKARVNDLRLEMERLNSLHLYRSIPDDEYDNLVDCLEKCIAFVTP